MAGSGESILRADENDPLIPEEMANLVIEGMPKASVVMSRARRVPLSRKKARQPVLSALPSAYWVDGDTGLKQTTKQQWKNVWIEAEELAAIVVIPDAYFDDVDVPLWDAVYPRVAEAMGLAIDGAALFDLDKPASWPDAVVPKAIEVGNVIVDGTGVDFGQDVANLGVKLAKQGYSLNGFAAEPGLNWRLIGLRDADGRPIYSTGGMAEGQPASLYGRPINEVDNGAWDEDQAVLLGGDWSKAVVGVRQDISYKIFSEGVISDDDGKVILNLMQQDAKAMRVVMRVGFTMANPINRLEEDETLRYPFGVIAPAGS